MSCYYRKTQGGFPGNNRKRVRVSVDLPYHNLLYLFKRELQGKNTLVAAVWYKFQELVFLIMLDEPDLDRKSTRLNSSHANISYAVFCLKKKNKKTKQ